MPIALGGHPNVTLDHCHVTRYACHRDQDVRGQAHAGTLYLTGKAKRFPPDVARRAARKLEYVDLAIRLDDLKVPPGNRLHALERERKGQHAISVNDQWRICFRFEDGDAYDVEITDYH